MRIAVARLESTFFIPILASIDVNAAKTADRNAATYQLIYVAYYKIEGLVKDCVWIPIEALLILTHAAFPEDDVPGNRWYTF